MNWKPFIAKVLGRDGSRALLKASKKNPAIMEMLLPRTAMGWLDLQKNYEGSLPGVENSYLRLIKTERGVSGTLAIEDIRYDFNEIDTIRLAAAISISLGFEKTQPEISGAVVARLGKNIDAILNTQQLIKNLHKTELPGQSAKPIGAMGPNGPQAPITKQPPKAKPTLPKKKIPALKIEKEQSEKECSSCGGKMFKSEKFIGCWCFRDLAKNVKTTSYSDGLVLEFNGLDSDSVAAIVEEFTNG